ncbi:hypothetical protein [Paenibacillus chungangensis]|uniref:Uncharacterized protein n=1 Tax=Paenibacillus chungangensis TaxID=696535 RepID=A0ABW3HUT9_9BACL
MLVLLMYVFTHKQKRPLLTFRHYRLVRVNEVADLWFRNAELGCRIIERL